MNVQNLTFSTPADEYFVRRAVRRDIPEISALVAHALSAHRGDAPDGALQRYIEHVRNFAARWDNGDVLVAQQYGRILGTVTVYSEASLGLPTNWASFGTLAVQPQVQGRGIGSILVRRCIAAAIHFAPTIGIHTGGFMCSARRMYEGMGFVRSPGHDLTASGILGFDPAEGDIEVLAYRLELDAALSG